MAPPIALQLYTVRDSLSEGGLPAALDIVAAAGYRYVELFSADGGLWGLDAKTAGEELDARGLSVLSAHVPIECFEQADEQGNLIELADRYAAIGCADLVIPWLSPERRGSKDQRDEVLTAIARDLDEWGARLQARGQRLGYHNHEFELVVAGGPGSPDGLEAMRAELSTHSVFFELDVYWLAFAGLDPALYIRRFGPRLRLLHLKDGSLEAAGGDPENARFAPLGQGDLDIPRIVEAAIEVGVQGLIVEQDFCEGPPLDAARASLEFLSAIPALQGEGT